MFSRLVPADHACISYGGPESLRGLLDEFTETGVDEERMTVFIHPFDSDDDALAFLGQGRVPYSELLGKEFFLVSYYKDAFEGGRDEIDYDHVVNVLSSLEATARERGTQLGIFVDASHQYLSTGREEEWFAFEEWLGVRLKNEVGLVCAYRDEDLADPARKARVLRAHLYRFT